MEIEQSPEAIIVETDNSNIYIWSSSVDMCSRKRVELVLSQKTNMELCHMRKEFFTSHNKFRFVPLFFVTFSRTFLIIMLFEPVLEALSW